MGLVKYVKNVIKLNTNVTLMIQAQKGVFLHIVKIADQQKSLGREREGTEDLDIKEFIIEN